MLSYLQNMDNKNKAIIVCLVAVFLSLAILNRWIITDLGLASFGRLWQYYVSYLDYGFLRRSLFGTFLGITHLNQITTNPYIFAYYLYTCKIVILSVILLNYIIRNKLFSTTYAYAAIFLSPALILQSAYATGTQDLELLIIVTIIFLYIKNWWVFGLLSIIGLLIHELYFFLFPAALLSVYLKRSNDLQIISREVVYAVIVTIIIALGLIALTHYHPLVNQHAFETTMSKKMGIAAYHHALWSGYLEIFSSVKENKDIGTQMLLSLKNNFLYPLIPFSYALSWAIINAKNTRTTTWKKFFILLVLLFPLLASFVASDLYRWIGMSANISILYAILYTKIKGEFISKRMFLFLLLFSLFAPFGAAGIERPFPAHQLMLEKIFHK